MTEPKSHLPSVVTIWVAPSPDPLNGWDAQISVTGGMTLVEQGVGMTAIEAARNIVTEFEKHVMDMAIRQAGEDQPL